MTHRVVQLVFDDVVAFDLGVPAQIFGTARASDGTPHYRVTTCGPGRAPVRTNAGFSALPDDDLDALADADTVIVPGLDGRSAAAHGDVPAAIRDALRTVAPRVRLLSICTGAFALAAAGLLDDRPATTHWWYADRFRSLYPAVKLDPDVLFVDDGDVLTSAGVAAGIDLCLHIVRRDHGTEVANRAARRSVVPPWRDGGQAQFIEQPVPRPTDTSTAATRDWALRRLGDPIDLTTMAAHAQMSVRTFTRRFRAETGSSPGEWLIRQRVERARQLLETTDLPIDRVSRDAGFASPVSLRQHLHATVGVSPATYRRTFRR